MEAFRQHEFGARLKRSRADFGQVVTAYMIIMIIIDLSRRIFWPFFPVTDSPHKAALIPHFANSAIRISQSAIPYSSGPRSRL
jgi:hypothetical protein